MYNALAAVVLLLIIVVVIVIVLLRWSRNGLSPCVSLHSPNGENYPWLNDIHGGLSKVMYEEPADSGKWRDYDDRIWSVHCRVVDHSQNLVEAHMRAFVYPNTRFARLHFYFKDGTVMEPTREFYEREAAWFGVQ